MDFDQIKQYQLGFLTLEILLAMAIMIIALSGAILMLFGGQSLAADSRLSSEALNYAQKLLEKRRALGLKDFRLVNSSSEAEGIFNGKVKVSSHSPFVKNVIIEVEWGITGRPQKVGLETLIADYNGTAGNDTCDSNLSGDWAHPQVKEFDFFELTGVASSTISDIDAYKSKLYVTAGGSATSTDPTFFIFDISNPEDIKFKEKIDNNSNNKSGLNAVAVNGDYAYVANSSSDNQLQIFNLKKFPIESPEKYNIENVNGGKGNSIFYDNGYIYLGLTSTSNNTPEFYIIDVKNASSTMAVSHWPSGGSLGHDINSIYVKGKYVYLAHPTDADGSGGCPQEQLTVLDISNPADSHLRRVGGFYDDGMAGNGKSLYLIGDMLYLGKTNSHISGPPDTIPEFYILDNASPENLKINNSASPRPYAKEINSSVDGIIVRDYLAFLLTKTNFQILKIDDLPNIFNWGSAAINAASGEFFEPSFDCEGNYFFIGSNNGGKSYISVITAK